MTKNSCLAIKSLLVSDPGTRGAFHKLEPLTLQETPPLLHLVNRKQNHMQLPSIFPVLETAETTPAVLARMRARIVKTCVRAEVVDDQMQVKGRFVFGMATTFVVWKWAHRVGWDDFPRLVLIV